MSFERYRFLSSYLSVDAFLRLRYLMEKEEYLETARRTLEYLASSYQRYGILAAAYGLAWRSTAKGGIIAAGYAAFSPPVVSH